MGRRYFVRPIKKIQDGMEFGNGRNKKDDVKGILDMTDNFDKNIKIDKNDNMVI